jgi:hypothetical protein
LLIFKKGINDRLNAVGKISTWSTKKDCCSWEGVYCDNITGRVTELHLSDQYLKGEMNLLLDIALKTQKQEKKQETDVVICV